MIVARDDESDTDVRVSELMLGLTDMSLLVCLGFIKVNNDLVASWSHGHHGSSRQPQSSSEKKFYTSIRFKKKSNDLKDAYFYLAYKSHTYSTLYRQN